MMKTKTKTNVKCVNCAEERKKADTSRKYAHELKNIFITISTVVDSEMEFPTQTFSLVSTNSTHIADSGDVSPFIMEGRRQRVNSKANNNNNSNNNKDSPFYFLKTLCDYGKTLIKEINEMGKDITDNNNEVKPFNIAKAIDFCVDMFDTKRKYDKAKRHLQIYSDINFSYDKEIKSISETGFKMVLINLLTNSYKFTIKGKIIVRAVSMPKEKKIRILVKDSGKGFNPKDFIKNGCFYVYEKNQDLNVDGSGLGLTIVNEILTKFNIKLDCISSTEKGGSLFYFDLDDTYPYYDEINLQNLMTNSLTQIIKDINSGKKDNEFNNNNTLTTKPTNNLKDKIVNMNNKNINNKKFEIEKNNNYNNNNVKTSNKNVLTLNNNKNSNKNVNILNNNKININNNKRFSFMEGGDIINCSPTFNNNNKSNEKKISQKNIKNSLEKNTKNLNVNIYNLNNATLFSFEKGSKIGKKVSIANNDKDNQNMINAIITTPNKKKIDRYFSLQKQFSINKESTNNVKKEVKTNMLKQIIEDSHNYHKLKTFNNSAKKGKEMQGYKGKNKKSSMDDVYKFMIEDENEDEDEELNEMNSEIRKIKEEKKKQQQKNYKKLLDKNFNKTRFYLYDLKKIFLKNEIYIHLSQRKNKKCITEPSSELNSPKKLKQKKSFYNNNNKVYIIICDDEEFVARSARELIINYYTKKGKEPHVYFTPNGIECLYLMYKLSIIENRKIEYILMDLEMPYLNGVKTCNIIKSIKETNVPVYILSGDEPNDCSANGYCNKPLNEVDIINKLDKENI